MFKKFLNLCQTLGNSAIYFEFLIRDSRTMLNNKLLLIHIVLIEVKQNLIKLFNILIRNFLEFNVNSGT